MQLFQSVVRREAVSKGSGAIILDCDAKGVKIVPQRIGEHGGTNITNAVHMKVQHLRFSTSFQDASKNECTLTPDSIHGNAKLLEEPLTAQAIFNGKPVLSSAGGRKLRRQD